MLCDSAKLYSLPVALLCCLILNGCAVTPWTVPVEDDNRQSIETTYRKFAESQNRCLSGWDADIVVDWKSSVNDFTFPAYLQALPPSFFKLVVSNPLGQPLKLLSTDGKDYQYIDVLNRSSIGGSTRSWVVRYDLPYTIVNRSWPDWLQGRPDGGEQRLITEIRQDGENRGAWLTIADKEYQTAADTGIVENDLAPEGPMQANIEDEQEPDESATDYPVYAYLLVDTKTGVVKEQIIVDKLQKRKATIIYNQWHQIDTCLYPLAIEITDLPYGGHIQLKFSEIRQADLYPTDFSITVPPGFARTLMP